MWSTENSVKKRYEIEILPHDKHIQVKSGQRLKDALAASSILIRSDCGGKGICGKCKVNKISSTGEKESITACNYVVTEDIRIDIPQSALFSSHVISKATVCLPPWFINRMNRKASLRRYGIAVDLGTTTIAIYLCNSSVGEVISSISLKNPQAIHGDDVMSRIGWIRGNKSNPDILQELVVRSIEQGMIELLKANALETNDISQIVVVGNPTMIHIISGVNPESIGISPYRPAFYEARTIDSQSVGFNFNHVPIRTLPQISGFIGGDILSAALATNLDHQPDGTLLIDLGTNGELLIKAGKKLLATSCATGPAFEGASLACGMQAIPGAINKVELRDSRDFPIYSVINSEGIDTPIGLCGTGAISAVAELWRNRIITPGGAFASDNSIKPLKNEAGGTCRYIIVDEDMNHHHSSIFISQKDIRAVQLGKAALISGIEFLTRAAGFSKPNKIIIAGSFGAFIDMEDMMAIGMIPDIKKEDIEIAGNSAGVGAIMVLSDTHYYTTAIDMSQKIKTIELADNTDFQKVFLKHLNFS